VIPAGGCPGPAPRLVWLARDARELEVTLARTLGAEGPAPGGLFAGPAGPILRAWAPGCPGPMPGRFGRLAFEPAEATDGGMTPAEATDGGRTPAGSPWVVAAVGWATVDLDRAQRELGAWLDPVDGQSGDVSEPLLGARARVLAASALPGGRLVLLEPVTEGRLAASLARDGEGPCALYLAAADPGLEPWLRDARGRGVAVSKPSGGPLGPAALLFIAPVGGPHVLIVDAAGPPGASPARRDMLAGRRDASGGTIRP
jgi:hypothetical protein